MAPLRQKLPFATRKPTRSSNSLMEIPASRLFLVAPALVSDLMLTRMGASSSELELIVEGTFAKNLALLPDARRFEAKQRVFAAEPLARLNHAGAPTLSAADPRAVVGRWRPIGGIARPGRRRSTWSLTETDAVSPESKEASLADLVDLLEVVALDRVDKDHG